MTYQRQYHARGYRHTVADSERATLLGEVLRNGQVACDIDLFAYGVPQLPHSPYSYGVIREMHPNFV